MLCQLRLQLVQLGAGEIWARSDSTSVKLQHSDRRDGHERERSKFIDGIQVSGYPHRGPRNEAQSMQPLVEAITNLYSHRRHLHGLRTRKLGMRTAQIANQQRTSGTPGKYGNGDGNDHDYDICNSWNIAPKISQGTALSGEWRCGIADVKYC